MKSLANNITRQQHVSEAGLRERTLGINLRGHFAAMLFLNTFHSLVIVVILQTRNSELVIYVLVQLFTKYKAA